MTIEQVELRKILSQMLADNGVNRETIIPFVKDVLQEKMDRAAKQVAAETISMSLCGTSLRRKLRMQFEMRCGTRCGSALLRSMFLSKCRIRVN